MLLLLALNGMSQTLPQDLSILVSRQLNGFRLAEDTDFIAALKNKRERQSVLQEDFDKDGRRDWAAIVINPRSREYRIYYVLNQATGPKFELLLTRTWASSARTNPINTPMFLKPAGDAGISGRTYNDLGPSPGTTARGRAAERTLYTSLPAIEVWIGQQHDERDTDLEDISYCSRTWYYDTGKLKQFDACD
jgi:hypothetical protein